MTYSQLSNVELIGKLLRQEYLHYMDIEGFTDLSNELNKCFNTFKSKYDSITYESKVIPIDSYDLLERIVLLILHLRSTGRQKSITYEEMNDLIYEYSYNYIQLHHKHVSQILMKFCTTSSTGINTTYHYMCEGQLYLILVLVPATEYNDKVQNKMESVQKRKTTKNFTARDKTLELKCLKNAIIPNPEGKYITLVKLGRTDDLYGRFALYKFYHNCCIIGAVNVGDMINGEECLKEAFKNGEIIQSEYGCEYFDDNIEACIEAFRNGIERGYGKYIIHCEKYGLDVKPTTQIPNDSIEISQTKSANNHMFRHVSEFMEYVKQNQFVIVNSDTLGISFDNVNLLIDE